MPIRSPSHPAITSQHYRMLELQSRTESANQRGIVCFLYHELMEALDLAIASEALGGAAAGSTPVMKAESIITALEDSLDLERGGDLAMALARIYRACRQGLAGAANTNDGRKISEIREAISSIAYAWQTLSGG